MSTPILFFDEKDANTGFLSNFHKLRTPLSVEGKLYATSEHYYQALKFDYPGADAPTLEYAELVRTADTPNKSRLLAKQKTGGGYKWRTALNPTIARYAQTAKLRPQWEENKLDMMRRALKVKFTQQPELRAKLLATGDAPLAENSPFDSYWGLGRDQSGTNWLGKLLMRVRSELRATDEEAGNNAPVPNWLGKLLTRARPDDLAEDEEVEDDSGGPVRPKAVPEQKKKRARTTAPPDDVTVGNVTLRGVTQMPASAVSGDGTVHLDFSNGGRVQSVTVGSGKATIMKF